MMLLKFREQIWNLSSADQSAFVNPKSVDGYRWTLQTARGRLWATIGFVHQYRSLPARAWHDGGGYYELEVHLRPRFGSYHDYYDGPHCGLSLGFFSLHWSGAWCDKCMPDERQ